MVGEFAHINGFKQSSARYSEDISDNVINDESNLILLCRDCHKIIDSDPITYTTEYLRKIKYEHEMQTLENINTIVNKTKIGGYVSFKTFNRFSKYLLDGNEPDEEFNYYLKSAKRLVNALKDMSFPVRSALYDLSQDVLINKVNEKLKRSFWFDCYPREADLSKIIDPLCNWKYIDVDDWLSSEELDPEIKICEIWRWIIQYLNINKIPLKKIILERDLTAFD